MRNKGLRTAELYPRDKAELNRLADAWRRQCATPKIAMALARAEVNTSNKWCIPKCCSQFAHTPKSQWRDTVFLVEMPGFAHVSQATCCGAITWARLACSLQACLVCTTRWSLNVWLVPGGAAAPLALVRAEVNASNNLMQRTVSAHSLLPSRMAEVCARLTRGLLWRIRTPKLVWFVLHIVWVTYHLLQSRGAS
jgi:hypothetical protein